MVLSLSSMAQTSPAGELMRSAFREVSISLTSASRFTPFVIVSGGASRREESKLLTARARSSLRGACAAEVGVGGVGRPCSLVDRWCARRASGACCEG